MKRLSLELAAGFVLTMTVVLLSGSAPAEAKDVPYLSGRVNDLAGIIPPQTRDGLESKLKAFEQETGAQVAVLTIDSLDGEVLEDFSHRVASTWKLGQQGKDNGVLFLVARDDRKMRLEVGYGLEAALTDAQSRRILDHVVRPKFRAGDFGGGVEAGVDAVVGTLRGQADAIPAEAPSASANEMANMPWPMRLLMAGMFFTIVGVFSVIAFFQSGCHGWFLYVFLMPFYFAFPLAFAGPVFGLGIFLVWLLGFPIGKALFGPRSAWGKGFLASHPGWKGFVAGSGSSGSGWSSGWSSGGFSGGGGSFGGGGSSSSW